MQDISQEANSKGELTADDERGGKGNCEKPLRG